MPNFVTTLSNALSLETLWDKYDLTEESNIIEVITILCDHEVYDKLSHKFHVACQMAGWSLSRIQQFERMAIYRTKFSNREFVKDSVPDYHKQWAFGGR